jgi:hypothetical protein
MRGPLFPLHLALGFSGLQYTSGNWAGRAGSIMREIVLEDWHYTIFPELLR